MKKLKCIKILFFLFSLFLVRVTLATPSPNWFIENGFWKIKDNFGNVITNAWVCDDTDSQKPWYLIDANGNMVTGIAIVDSAWYLLENNGRLKSNSGYCNNVYLEIDSSGAIKNSDGLMMLWSQYGSCHIINADRTIYTSSLSNSSATVHNIDDMPLDNATAIIYARQLGESLGLRIEELPKSIRIHGIANDHVTISEFLPDILCTFLDPVHHGWTHLTLSGNDKTAKNIQGAIKRLTKLK